jgi:hypothetical protein
VQRLQQEEELTTQLAKETEQVPQLIVLYQQQRQKLEQKMAEQEEMLRRAWREVQMRGGDAAPLAQWSTASTTAPSAPMPAAAWSQPSQSGNSLSVGYPNGGGGEVWQAPKIPTPEPVVPPPKAPRVDPAFIWGDNAELDGNYDVHEDGDDAEREAALEKARVLAAKHREAVQNPWPRETGIFVL